MSRKKKAKVENLNMYELFGTPEARQLLIDDAFASGDYPYFVRALHICMHVLGIENLAKKLEVAPEFLGRFMQDYNPSIKEVIEMLQLMDLGIGGITIAPPERKEHVNG